MNGGKYNDCMARFQHKHFINTHSTFTEIQHNFQLSLQMLKKSKEKSLGIRSHKEINS